MRQRLAAGDIAKVVGIGEEWLQLGDGLSQFRRWRRIRPSEFRQQGQRRRTRNAELQKMPPRKPLMDLEKTMKFLHGSPPLDGRGRESIAVMSNHYGSSLSQLTPDPLARRQHG